MIKFRICFAYILVFSFFISCGDKDKAAEQISHNFSGYDTISLPPLKGLKPYLRLTSEAQTVTQNWSFYKEITQTLDSLGTGTIGQTRRLVAQLDKTYTNLKESQQASVALTPEELKSQPIQARLAALETQIKVLKNEVDKNNPSANLIAASIVKSKNALQNLNLQIDERFALSIEEILEAAHESPDSLVIKNAAQSLLPELEQN